jgi:hypothetical protein
VNLQELFGASFIGLLFLLVFFGLMIIFAAAGRSRPGVNLRNIPAFTRLGRSIGLAVEAGKRLHLSLGRGGLADLPGASALVGLSVLSRITRVASISDRPPVATSGDATLALLSQDTLKNTYEAIGEDSQYDPGSAQLSGLTPFSYAAGTLPLIYDEEVSASILIGHFGSEAALITDAAERVGSLTMAGSDNLTAQAVFYATAEEPLIGEELYAAGAYVNAGLMHAASLRAQDVLRWVVAAAILVGAVLKLFDLV